MTFHKLANLFPLMDDAATADLAEDIKANGQREPILVFEDKILDGRNRFRACELAGVKPRFEAFKGDSPASLVVSMNLKRRHLTDSQKACVATEVLPWLEREAKERRKETEGRPSKLTPKIESVTKGESAEQAGALLGVSRSYVAAAKAIKSASPELFEEVKSGEKTISQAKREVKRAEVSKKIPALPSSKYRVLYADPPWSYNDKCDDGAIQAGGCEKHYPSMTVAELCAMSIQEITEDNAVLFLWTTSPLLFECEPVFRAWGFAYKASFVWDKVKHNMGHYNSVRHEFLLVCTKGSCTPDVVKLSDSVQSIVRGKHSEKPKEFRDIIDTLYPHGRRIELFARTKAKGWESYGNEC